jgi:hypothetical protein
MHAEGVAEEMECIFSSYHSTPQGTRPELPTLAPQGKSQLKFIYIMRPEVSLAFTINRNHFSVVLSFKVIGLVACYQVQVTLD